jgi:hypothetical protein
LEVSVLPDQDANVTIQNEALAEGFDFHSKAFSSTRLIDTVPVHATKLETPPQVLFTLTLAHRWKLRTVKGGLLGIWYPWQEPVMLALMEFEPQQLEVKINVALQAIAARRTEIKDSADSREERIALEDAVNALKVVKQNRPGA